jgi:hypothetical protein
MQKNMFICFACGLALGCAIAGFWGYLRGAQQARYFDERTAELDRQYADRQRELVDNNRELTGLVDSAGAIVERTADSLGRAAENSTEASAIIGDVYRAITDIDRLLNNRDSGGGGAGGADRAGD